MRHKRDDRRRPKNEYRRVTKPQTVRPSYGEGFDVTFPCRMIRTARGWLILRLDECDDFRLRFPGTQHADDPADKAGEA